MRVGKIITAILFVAFLFGCGTNGSSIVTGELRPETNPSDVKLYVDPPPRFETIGIVEASRDVEFSRQRAQDKVIEDLKILAAKMGANGLLLTSTGTQPSGASGGFGVGTSFGGSSGGVVLGFGTGSTDQTIVGQGRAIYVFDELELTTATESDDDFAVEE